MVRGFFEAAMLLRVLEEKPAVERVDTGNAGSNAPMLSINHALGFRSVRVGGSWQGDLHSARKRLADRA